MSELHGKLVIISGPSGAGKSTVVERLLQDGSMPLMLSVSATTRQPREDEKDGIHYHFLSPVEFKQKREQGEFLEFKEVFGRGDWYGTLEREVTAGLKAGKWVLLEIDVEGALSVLEHRPDAVTIFIHSGSLSELEKRLRQRGTESEKSLARRLEVARSEMAQVGRYRYEVVNDSIDQAVVEILEILRGEDEAPKD